MINFKTHSQLIESLKRHNIHFKDFTLVTEGYIQRTQPRLKQILQDIEAGLF
jgi:hypothetical protein